jgi:hypothetical protein
MMSLIRFWPWLAGGLGIAALAVMFFMYRAADAERDAALEALAVSKATVAALEDARAEDAARLARLSVDTAKANAMRDAALAALASERTHARDKIFRDPVGYGDELRRRVARLMCDAWRASGGDDRAAGTPDACTTAAGRNPADGSDAGTGGDMAGADRGGHD